MKAEINGMTKLVNPINKTKNWRVILRPIKYTKLWQSQFRGKKKNRTKQTEKDLKLYLHTKNLKI